MNAFPKIFTVGQRWVQNIFDSDVEITEKIDGSQIGFGKINNTLIVRSKGIIQQVDCPDKLFSKGIDYIKSIESSLPNGIMFYGEYLQKEKHNVLCYGRVPKNNIILFGACYENGKFIFDYYKYADLLNLETVPILFKGKINNFEQLKEMLQRESVLGKAKIEGFVVKNYNKEILLDNRIIPLLCAKYVSEEFKEVHQKNWSRENTGKGKWEVYKEGFCTEARWLKAIFYLRDNGVLDNSPKDIGLLMKRVNEDITEEEKENIKDFLWNEFGREVLKTATRGLSEWYKEYLAKKSFGEENG